MATIKDVAKRANVSISTVSLAFNNPERVSENTRNKIFNAARILNYISANQVRKKESVVRNEKTVAVLMENIIGPFWFEILHGIAETLNVSGYEMALFSSNDSFDKHFLDLVNGKECLGIILISIGENHVDILKMAAAQHFPIVMCDPVDTYAGIGSVRVDQHYVGQLAAEHFIQLKKKKIAILGTFPKHCVERKIGFIETLKNFDIQIPDNWNIDCMISEEQSYQTMYSFLEDEKDLPDAIFCVNDEAAIGTIHALQKFEIDVPKAVSVIGCDNISIGRFNNPMLTTIEIPKYEVGVLAANMVLRMISGLSAENILLNGKLIVRESTCLTRK